MYYLDSGSLFLDEMGGIWRKGWMNEHRTVDAVRVGTVEGHVRVEPEEEDDLEWLEKEWARLFNQGRAERDERWAEYWRSG